MLAHLGIQHLQKNYNHGSWVTLRVSLGVILRPHRGPEAFEKALEEVLDAVLLKT